MPMEFIPRPTDSWPSWAVVAYYLLVALAVLVIAI